MFRPIFTFISIFILISFISCTLAANIYVDPVSGDDSNNGSTEVLSKKTISSALTAANADDTIVLKDGTYSASGNCNLSVTKKVSIVGNVDSPSNVIIDCNYESRAFTIESASIDNTVVYEGFTVQKAIGDNGIGGAFHIKNSAPKINKIIVKNCKAETGSTSQQGSAFYISSSSSSIPISNTIIENNVATKGAVFLIRSQVVFTNVTFDGNTGNNGGAIYGYRSTLGLVNSTIQNNKASERGGGFYLFMSIIDSNSTVYQSNEATLDGGALYSYDSTIQFTSFKNSKFLNNTSGGVGGGAYFFVGLIQIEGTKFIGNKASGGAGGGLYVYTHNKDSPQIKNIEADSNEATGSGGGVFLTLSFPSCESASIEGSVFKNNIALTSGGGLSIEGASGCKAATFNSNEFENNTATSDGGGLHVFNLPVHIQNLKSTKNKANAYGGGAYILVNDATTQLTWVRNCEFSQNEAPYGGGLYSNINPVDAQISIKDSISTNNKAQQGGGIMISSRASVYFEGVNTTLNKASESGAGIHISSLSLYINSTKSIGNTLATVGTEVANALKGAGAYFSVGSASINSSTITENISGTRGSGGGVYINFLSTTTSLSFFNNILSKNKALEGAGLHAKKSSSLTNTPSLSIIDTEASENEVVSSLDTDVSSGAGLSIGNLQTVILTRVSLLKNKAQTLGTSQGIGLELIQNVIVNITDSNINENVITGSNFNRRGSGLYIDRCSNVNIINTIFDKNKMEPDSSFRGSSQGAALYSSQSTVNIDSSTFSNNEAVTGTTSASGTSFGGALFATSSSVLDIKDSTISSNKATGNSLSTGGGLYAETSSKIIIKNTICSSNTAAGEGGCAALKETNIESNSNGFKILSNNANVGGGIVIIQTTFKMTNSEIKSNIATLSGGAARLSSGVFELSYTDIKHNNATYRGGVHSLPPNNFTTLQEVSIENNNPLFYEPYGVWIVDIPKTSVPPGIVFTTTPIILVKDYYNETVVSGSHTVQITTSSSNVILSENIVQSDEGIAKFPKINLLGEIGTQFNFQITGPSISKSETSSTISIEGCPVGYQFNVDRCILCEDGYFSVNGSVCTNCPSGASCSSGILLPKDNFWKYDLTSTSVHRCLFGMCEENGKCKSHHTGVLCAECEDGYSIYQNRCVKCPVNGHQFWLLFPLIIWLVFSGIVLRFLKEFIPVLSMTFFIIMQFIVFMLGSMRHDISVATVIFNLDATICLAKDVFTKMLIINLTPLAWLIVFLSMDLLKTLNRILTYKKISIKQLIKGNIEGIIWLNMMTVLPTTIYNIAYFIPRTIDNDNFMVLDFRQKAFTPLWAYWTVVPALGFLVYTILTPFFGLLCILISGRKKSVMLRDAKKSLSENIKKKISEMIKNNRTDEEIKEFEAKVNTQAHYKIYDQPLTTIFDLTFFMKHMNVKTGYWYLIFEFIEKLLWAAAIAATYGQPSFEFYRMAFISILIVCCWSIKLFTSPYRGKTQTVVLITQVMLGIMSVVYLSSVAESSPSLKLPYDIIIFIIWVAIILVYIICLISIIIPYLTQKKAKVYIADNSQDTDILLQDYQDDEDN